MSTLPCLLTIKPPEDKSLGEALTEIVAAFPWRFSEADGQKLLFQKVSAPEASLMTISRGGEEAIVIEYSSPRSALRALGIVMGHIEAGGELQPYTERSNFETLGVMLDVSRNAVLRIDALRTMIRSFALMGINQLLLYMEDTYEIPNVPMFGYFRGRYTYDELKQIDDYAFLFGIEVVPCIQTLGHLEQVIKWPTFREFVDTESILLAGDDGTMHFIDQMIGAASAPFRSRRIHLGMDEADGVGSGAFRSRNGYVPPFEIIAQHLDGVVKLCEKRGLSPLIWSDMFFRLGSKTNDYYDPELVTPPEITNRIPANVDLVYWDYVHTEQIFYSNWIARHRAMGKEPVYAGGIWTWSRLWAALQRSFVSLKAGVKAARDAELKEAFVTIWGDDGTECDFFSALPAVQYFVEQALAPEYRDCHLDIHFQGTSNASASAWIHAAQLDYSTEFGEASLATANLGKWLLWHDPILSFLDQQVPASAPEHYKNLAHTLYELSQRSKGNIRLEFPAKVASVLAAKSAIHLNLRKAYKDKNINAIRGILECTLPELNRSVQVLWTCHETLWKTNNKMAGWEVLDKRYGALLARLAGLTRRLDTWLASPNSIIEEFEHETTSIYTDVAPSQVSIGYRMASSSSPFC